MFVVLALVFSACRKDKDDNHPVYPVDAALLSDFSFSPGTYWIYQDTATGVLDSAWVTARASDSVPLGCVIVPNETYYQQMTVSIAVKSITPYASDSATWVFTMEDTTLYFYQWDSNDSATYMMGGFALANYPIKTGDCHRNTGCIFSRDSSSIQGTSMAFSSGACSFSNVALSLHTNSLVIPNAIKCDDHFYIAPGAGIAKLSLSHPSSSTYRTLQLVRYHVVK